MSHKYRLITFLLCVACIMQSFYIYTVGQAQSTLNLEMRTLRLEVHNFTSVRECVSTSSEVINLDDVMFLRPPDISLPVTLPAPAEAKDVQFIPAPEVFLLEGNGKQSPLE